MARPRRLSQGGRIRVGYPDGLLSPNLDELRRIQMVAINSILGDLDTGDLGFTLTHEHVWQSAAGINTTYPEFFDRQAIMATADRSVSSIEDIIM